MAAGFVCELVMTAMFILIILGATDKRAPAGLAPIAIGLALTLIHLISIPVTNTSVNPARSTGPALIVGGWAIQQLWMFWVAPLLGAVVGGVLYRCLGKEEQLTDSTAKISLPIGQGSPRVLGVRQYAQPLLLQKVLHRRFQPGMAQVVPGMGDDRLESANQLVFTLGSGIETLISRWQSRSPCPGRSRSRNAGDRTPPGSPNNDRRNCRRRPG